MKLKISNNLFNAIFATTTLLVVIFFHKNILLTTVLEIIIATIGLIKWKSKRTLAIFIYAGIFGAIAEMAVIHTSGAWSYASPNIIELIPAWLFIIWASAGAFLYETSKEMHRMGLNK